MSFLTEYEFSRCLNRYNGDRHVIKFYCQDPFLIMIFAQLTNRSGWRDMRLL